MRRRRCACAVPISTPAAVGARQVAGGPSTEARAAQAPSRSSHNAAPSTTLHADAGPSASAVTDRPVSASTGRDVAPSSVHNPLAVPTKILVSMSE